MQRITTGISIGILSITTLAWTYSWDVELDPIFQQWIEEEREHTPENRNAYFYAMGFNCPAGSDPLVVGKRLFERYQSGESVSVWVEDSIEFPDDKLMKELLSSENLPQILESRTEIIDLLSRHEELLVRYQLLSEYPDFSMLTKPSLVEAYPPYRYQLAGQGLLQLKALDKINSGDTSEGVALLLSDLGHYRRLLRNADNLITKLVAIAAISRDARILHGIVKIVGLDSESQNTLMNMMKPLDPQERSWHKALKREAVMGRNTLLELKKMPFFRESKDDPGGVGEALSMRFRLKPNHASNMSLKWWRNVMKRSSLDARQFSVRIAEQAPATGVDAWDKFYNPVGTIFIQVSRPSMDDYIARIHDLDCLLALARASIKSESADQIAHQGEVNPYNGEPIALANGIASFDGPLEAHRGGRSLRVAW